jgi:hypothetical protein
MKTQRLTERAISSLTEQQNAFSAVAAVKAV